jgi:hypothetical protein
MYTKADLELLILEADSRLLSKVKEYNQPYMAGDHVELQEEIAHIKLFKECVYRLYYSN